MAEVYTFDYVPSDVATRIGNFTATTTTRPTFAEVEAIILEVAGTWCGFLIGKGIDPQAWTNQTTSVCYYISRRYIGAEVAARVIRAKERNDQELANRYSEEAQRAWKEVSENPQGFGAARPTGADAANITYVSPITDPLVLAAYRNYGTVSQRSAATNRM
jgi:hypothetical protein